MGNYTLVAYIGPLHIYKRDQRGKTIEECPQAQLYFEYHEILDWIQVSKDKIVFSGRAHITFVSMVKIGALLLPTRSILHPNEGPKKTTKRKTKQKSENKANYQKFKKKNPATGNLSQTPRHPKITQSCLKNSDFEDTL